MDKSVFATNYANALFQLFKSHHELDSGLTQLNNINTVLSQVPELTKALDSAFVSNDEKTKLINPLLKAVDSKYILNLLKVTFNAGYVGALPSLIKQFKVKYDNDKGIAHARYISAIPLSDTQKQQLNSVIAQRENIKKIIPKYIIDKNIIGGLEIKLNNKIIDDSIKTRINTVKEILLND